MKTLAIIPCAGFGTRMGMLPSEAKEMLPDPSYGHKHIIDYSIDICNQYNLEPIFISRKEKKSLNDYLRSQGKTVLIIETKGEWQNSVLMSKDYWHENNILLLPDTRFSPQNVINDIQKSLKLGNNACLGLHEVPDPPNWGIIANYTIIEKPFGMGGPQNAWGLIGFKGSYGEELFSKMGTKLTNVGFTFLDYFVDITRKK